MSTELSFYGKLRPAAPGSIIPGGSNMEFLRIQQNGLTGNFAESGYPFDTPMWDGGVGIIRSAPIIHNDEETPSPSQDAWWPYEQSAYLLDGILKTAILTGDKTGIGFFEKNLFYLIRHPDDSGILGTHYHCDIHWPMAPFFRAAQAYAEYTGNQEVKAAFIRHYTALDAKDIGTGFRHINNLEGVLTAYRWSGEKSLLDKAVKAYRIHNEFFRHDPDGIRELYFDKIKDMEKHILHGVTFSEGIKLPVMLYMYTGDLDYLEKARHALQAVLERHGTIAGLPSANEFFSGKDPLQGYESCLINDFTWALGIFLQATGQVEYADRMERIIYNALGGAVTADFTSLMYISSPNQVIAAPEANHAFFYRGSEDVMQFRPNHSAQCCPGNIHHALPNFIMQQFMYAADGTPAAMLYGESFWQGEYCGKGFTITETTAYPHDEKICFKIKSATPMPFAMRIPQWCKNANVLINDKDAGISAKAGSIARLTEVKDGDTVTLILPREVQEKHERHWLWFEAGALLYTLPVTYRESFESPSRFAPRSYHPESEWNYSPVSGSAKLLEKDGKTVIQVSATQVTGFDTLDQGRYTPQVPLYCRRYGEEKTLTLIPYSEAKLRITAFPDAVKRQPLFIYQALTTREYPYDESRPLSEQIFEPENLSPAELIAASQEILPEKDGYYDLLHHFGKMDKVLTYVTLRFWSDEDGTAVFSVGADTAAILWVNGSKAGELPPGSEGIFTAGLHFTSTVKKGYNQLLCKIAKGTLYEQYRNSWGVRADIFVEITE